MNSDHDRISATYFQRFVGSFLFDMDNVSDLNLNDFFIRDRSDKLLQSFLIGIISGLFFIVVGHHLDNKTFESVLRFNVQ